MAIKYIVGRSSFSIMEARARIIPNPSMHLVSKFEHTPRSFTLFGEFECVS